MDGTTAYSQQSWLWPVRFLGHCSMCGAVLPPDPSWPWKMSSGVWQSCASANKPERAWAGSVSLAERICKLGKMRISCSFLLSIELGRAGKPQPQSLTAPKCSSSVTTRPALGDATSLGMNFTATTGTRPFALSQCQNIGFSCFANLKHSSDYSLFITLQSFSLLFSVKLKFSVTFSAFNLILDIIQEVWKKKDTYVFEFFVLVFVKL